MLEQLQLLLIIVMCVIIVIQSVQINSLENAQKKHEEESKKTGNLVRVILDEIDKINQKLLPMVVRTHHDNQEHPIPRKKRCTDAQGNQFKRVFVTSGVSSMMLARGFKSDNAAIAFTEKVGELAERLGAQIAINFLVKPGK